MRFLLLWNVEKRKYRKKKYISRKCLTLSSSSLKFTNRSHLHIYISGRFMFWRQKTSLLYWNNKKVFSGRFMFWRRKTSLLYRNNRKVLDCFLIKTSTQCLFEKTKMGDNILHFHKEMKVLDFPLELSNIGFLCIISQFLCDIYYIYISVLRRLIYYSRPKNWDAEIEVHYLLLCIELIFCIWYRPVRIAPVHYRIR